MKKQNAVRFLFAFTFTLISMSLISTPQASACLPSIKLWTLAHPPAPRTPQRVALPAGNIAKWKTDQNEYGDCYAYAADGTSVKTLVSACEEKAPSVYALDRDHNGNERCYHFTPEGAMLDQGVPVHSSKCYGARPKPILTAIPGWSNLVASDYMWQDNRNYWNCYVTKSNCFHIDAQGNRLEISPVKNSLCEKANPTTTMWNEDGEGILRCFRFAANGLQIGDPVHSAYCL